MDKNKVVVIAVGAFIAGGVIGGAVGHMSEREWRHEQGNEKGMVRDMHDMMNRDAQSNARKNPSAQGDGQGMRGDETVGVAGMHMQVTSERAFLEGMIPHHEEAVATAKEVVVRGGPTPEIKTLAENIIKAQASEITDMKTWYKTWYGVEYAVTDNYQSMMRPLTNLSGTELDKVFLADMIKHHMGAIMMAQSVSAHIEHPEITTLVHNIKTTQSAEITEMQTLLKTLQS